jgi:predicted ATPase
MRLERLHVRRFKSLYDVDLSFDDFSILTGPNGSGKTNIVDAIAFLGEVYSFGVEYAVGRAGGIDAIAFRDKRRTTIGVTFEVKASFIIGEARMLALTLRRVQGNPGYEELRNQQFSITHKFTLKPASEQNATDYAVSTETLALSVLTEGVETTLFIARSADDGESAPDIESVELPVDMSDRSRRAAEFLRNNLDRVSTDSLMAVAPGASILEWLRILPAVREFQTRMSYIRAYRLNPAGCREPGVLTPNATLDSNGGNLPAVVARLSRSEPEVWSKVLAGMRQLLPDLEKVDAVPSAEHGLVLRFYETGRGRPWSAVEVSDGTIQTLAMLIALHDPRPPIVVVEEPENTVHPWVLRRFVEEARALRGKQVVLTTHSPVLLRLVRPEDVYLLWRAAGRTKVQRLLKLLPDARRLYYDEGFDVFELYDSGLIPEGVPGFVPNVMP